MALNFDSSPLRDFVENVAADTTPAIWLWQIAVGAGAMGLGWLAARALCRRVKPGKWKFGEGNFERVAFPLISYLLLALGRWVLARYQPVALLDILAAIFVAAFCLRGAVYVLGHVLPHGAMLRALVRVIAWLAWIMVLLHVTGLLPDVIAALDDVGFTTGKNQQRITLLLILEGLLALALALTIAMWIARITEGRVMTSEAMDMSTRVVIAKLVRISAALVAILVALPMVGIDLTTLSILGGAIGVGLGFGLQKIAANYVSGFIVLIDHSLRIGDTITIDGRRGEVKEIASRYTVVRGGDGTESIVPNEKLITEVVSHHTYSDPKMAITLPVTVTYDTDVDRACELLVAAAGRISQVIADPAAVARVKSLGDWGVQLDLTVWTDNPGIESEVRSDLYRDILRSFRQAGIEVAYPRRDVHLVAPSDAEKIR